MQLPIGEWVESFRAGIGLVPPPLIAMVLLGGPTAAWLMYHFVVQPRAARMRVFEREAFWVCPSCRSVNDYRLVRCYRCDAVPVEEDLELIDAHPSGPRPLIAVGPGLNLGAPASMTRAQPIASIDTRSAELETSEPWDTESEGWAGESEEEVDRAALPDVAAMTEVIEAPRRRRSPRAPAPTRVGPRPRRVAVAGNASDPDDPPAA